MIEKLDSFLNCGATAGFERQAAEAHRVGSVGHFCSWPRGAVLRT